MGDVVFSTPDPCDSGVLQYTKFPFYINHGPVSTVCQSEQIIPSPGVVSVVKTPIPPMDGNGNVIGIAIGGSMAGSANEIIGNKVLL